MSALTRIYLSAPHIGMDEERRVREVFASNWIAPLGPEVDGFEADLARYCSRGHAAGLSSGTAAIHLALKILGVGPGDVVIAPTFTFVATANPVRYLGAEPIFVDSERTTWNMCPDLLQEALELCKSRNRLPKAVLVVDLYGMPAQYDRILPICSEYGVPVIEDSAEALGSRFCGRPAGAFGALGILSFNGNKIITTSGGGALLGDDLALIERARFLATQARDPAPHYQHSESGFNYRLSNVLAAIGRAQLGEIESKVATRRAHFEAYVEGLNIYGLRFLAEPANVRANRWLTTVLFPETHFPREAREVVRQHLETLNIESRPLWKPLHLQPVFKDCEFIGSSVAEGLFDRGLCLPSGSGLSGAEISRVIAGVSEALSTFDTATESHARRAAP